MPHERLNHHPACTHALPLYRAQAQIDEAYTLRILSIDSKYMELALNLPGIVWHYARSSTATALRPLPTSTPTQSELGRRVKRPQPCQGPQQRGLDGVLVG